MYLLALKQLARIELAAGEYERAADYAKRVLVKNPLREEVHLLLMRIYAGMGDRLKVIGQYETLSGTLRRELGIEPARETRRELYELCGGEVEQLTVTG